MLLAKLPIPIFLMQQFEQTCIYKSRDLLPNTQSHDILDPQYKQEGHIMEYGKSIFLTKPNDPIAAVFTPEAFGACPDGTGDNTAALQRAIDEVVEKHYHGIIYVPEGTIVLRIPSSFGVAYA